MSVACCTNRMDTKNSHHSASGSYVQQPEDTSKASTTMRLSSYFNSSEATLRLAEMTAPGYVEELCNMFKLERRVMS